MNRACFTAVAAVAAILAAVFSGGCANMMVLPAAPYSGLEARPVKALSAEDAAGYLAGEGMGFALAAELNGYPGPRHVLELADELELSAAQRGKTQKLFLEMQTAAAALGKSVVAKETELDALFSEQRADENSLHNLTAEIARLKGALRAAHLKYHLIIKSMLTSAQIARYNELRGYHEHRQHH
ncbi:MAG: Spy/CpxP family protein refolding chaperone [Gammaproteobacteria bacterium]